MNFEYPIRTLNKDQFPFLLENVSALPKQLYIRGTLPSNENKFLCVIGSRKFTSYGKEVCKKLISGLKGYPIVIVSGLAIGIDSIAHEEALNAGLRVIAFPGSGIAESVLYPAANRKLAQRILDMGNAILSPFDLDQGGTIWTFPNRNRLMAGCSHATLIIEAGEKSGTMITASFTADFGRELLVVPNSIFEESSTGSNALLREGGIAVTTAEEVLEALGFDITPHSHQVRLDLLLESLTHEERLIIECLRLESLTSTGLIEKTSLSTSVFNVTISALELRGLISHRGSKYCLGNG